MIDDLTTMGGQDLSEADLGPETLLPLLTVNETADALRVQRSTLYALFASGELRSVRIMTRRFVPLRYLNDFLRDRAAAGGDSGDGTPRALGSDVASDEP